MVKNRYAGKLGKLFENILVFGAACIVDDDDLCAFANQRLNT